ncbi:hypothetical protein PROFUN_12753 [Planoprotostelium fungivorum]|uniref:F-box domain-containing protein n=1 Tax=Planoprotostelium fungivorum TaxID=1890364 RepID=A0A2P6N5I3_9EUKA|nr:hypothetical protein PROFUN_12753 [Planoprotostelium fungivorum]
MPKRKVSTMEETQLVTSPSSAQTNTIGDAVQYDFSFDIIPEEIILHIFTHLDNQTIMLICPLVCTTWYRLCHEKGASFWKQRCVDGLPKRMQGTQGSPYYLQEEPTNVQETSPFGWKWWSLDLEQVDDWHNQFYRRIMVDKRVKMLALELAETRFRATDKFRTIAQFGDEALDMLLKMWTVSWDLLLNPDTAKEEYGLVKSKAMSQSYWIGEMIGFLDRLRFIQIIRQMMANKDVKLKDACFGMERCLRQPPHASSSDLINAPLVFRDLIEQYRNELKVQFPGINFSDPPFEAVSYLVQSLHQRSHNRTGRDNDATLLGAAILGRKGYPISCCALLHAIATELGFTVNMVGFPFHFIASYKRRTTGESIFIDSFHGKTMSLKEIKAFGRERQIVWNDRLVEPTSHALVIHRIANNMANTVAQMTENLYSTQQRRYLISCILTEMSSLQLGLAEHGWRHRIRYVTNRYIWDTLLDGEWPIDASIFDEQMNIASADPQLIPPKQRNKTCSEGRELPQYKVGHIFHHRQRHYTGIILGWDYTCAATNEWMEQMNVNSLSRGSQQPFYHSYVIEDGSECYVAEENIIWSDVNHQQSTSFEILSVIGRYFDVYEKSGDDRHGRFIPCRDLLCAYPDDG